MVSLHAAWIGSRYRDARHKRLLVIGESHYLPPDSTIHRDPGRWYRSRQEELSGEEVRWASTATSGAATCSATS